MSIDKVEYDDDQTHDHSPPSNNSNNTDKQINDQPMDKIEYSETPKTKETFTYIDINNIDKDLICAICLDPLIDPKECSNCSKMICSDCTNHLTSENPCPFCKKDNFKENCKDAPTFVKKKLDELKVECSMCKGGVTRGELKYHKERTCPLLTAYNQVEEMKRQLQRQFNIDKMEMEELLKSQNKKNEDLLKEKTEEFEKQVLAREKFEKSNKPIHLNVRGKIMTVSLGDFVYNEREPENLFKKMFNGEHPLHRTPSKQFEDPIFINCDPIVFTHILHWLNFGIVSSEMSSDTKKLVLEFSKKFGLKNFEKELGQGKNTFHLKNLMDLHREKNRTLNLKRFSLRDLRGCDFSGCDLSGIDFQNCILIGCNFNNTINRKTNFANSDLTNATFENANLVGSMFPHCKFHNVKGLDQLVLSGIGFQQSKFTGCNLKGSTLISADFSGCNFENCCLEGTKLNNTTFSNSTFTKCKFDNEVKFKKTIFKGCTLQNVSGLLKIRFTDIDFSDCKINDTEISFESIVKTNFSNCNLSSSTFNSQIKFTNCDLSGCNLAKLNFRGFKFEKVTFSKTNIDGCNFENATFTECIIQQVEFQKNNNLKDCKLIECSINDSTFDADWKLIESSLPNSTTFKECTFKNMDLILLKDLSPYQGNKFDNCQFNFKEFTNKHIQNTQFGNIDFTTQPMEGIEFTNCYGENCSVDEKTLALLSCLIETNNIYSELYSHTKSKSIPQLLYRGTRDGFKAQEFHSKCDGKGPTLTIIKSEHNQIFGAFTSKSWQSPTQYGYVSDSSAFIFKISNSNNGNYQLEKFNIKQDNQQNAICVNKDYLPRFGGGTDIYISSDCNLNNNSYSNFGNTYELPNGYTYETNQAKSYLAGSYKFKVIEIEVFKIDQ